MRHLALAVSLPPLLLVGPGLAAPAAAQSGSGGGSFELSAVVEPAGSYSEVEGFDLDTGLGLGLGWRFTPLWTAELRALFHDGDSAASDTFQLGVHRSFDLGSTWRPFVVAGLHHQRTELDYEVVCFRAPCPPLSASYADTGIFLGGGADWQFARRAALRLEARQALYDSEHTDDLENATDLTAGIVARF